MFGKFRPGFITAPNAQLEGGFLFIVIGGPTPVQRFGRLTEKVFDVGGVFEYYPAKHWSVRLDAGDTLIAEEGMIIRGIVPIAGTPTTSTFGKGVTGHFQLSTGALYRF